MLIGNNLGLSRGSPAMPRSSAPASAATPPPATSYAHAAARTALALIVSEAHSSASSAGFDAVERSATEALLDIFTRYMRTVGTVTRAAAQHAGRSESNLADLLVGLDAVGAGGGAASRPHDLLQFVEEEATEAAFPCNISSFPVVRPPTVETTASTASTAGTDARPAHVPDFLPPFPDRRTYVRTATHNVRPSNVPAAKRRRSQHKRQAQESRLALAQAGASGVSAGDGAGTSGVSGTRPPSLARAAPPPPPLPDMPEPTDGADGAGFMREREGEGGPGRAGGAHDAGAAALRSVPDVLVAGMPATLQSASKLECSSVDVPPPLEAQAASEVRGDAITASANPRHAAILKLKHMHGLDAIEEGRGAGGAADTAGDD